MLPKLINSNTHRISCISKQALVLVQGPFIRKEWEYNRFWFWPMIEIICIRLIISITLELVLTLRMIIFYCRLIIIYIILFEKFKTTQTVFFLKFIKTDGISVVILSSLYESTFESCFYSIIRALSRAIKPDYTYDIVVSIMKVWKHNTANRIKLITDPPSRTDRLLWKMSNLTNSASDNISSHNWLRWLILSSYFVKYENISRIGEVFDVNSWIDSMVKIPNLCP
jgi:hypothetical protein